MALPDLWHEVFADLDARTLDHDQRLNFVNGQIEITLSGREWSARVGGHEGELAWEAALRSFLDGIWVATILCCHVVCEREVAGIISISAGSTSSTIPSNWDSFGLGRLLSLAGTNGLLPEDLINSLRELADVRKPYGHWRSADRADSLMQRVNSEFNITGDPDWANLTDRLLVRDATAALRTTVRLRFGSYGVGG